MTDIGDQGARFAKAVENTVAGGQGALTTGQARNEGGHVTVFNLLLNHIRRLKQFDVVNTTVASLTPLWRPPKAAPQTTRSSVALCRYQPEFQAIVMSIDMGLPLDAGTQRHVRLQMFVRGPYTGMHRYVASDGDVPLRSSASADAGRAFEYDMQHGMLDPFTLYWRPALFDASYQTKKEKTKKEKREEEKRRRRKKENEKKKNKEEYKNERRRKERGGSEKKKKGPGSCAHAQRLAPGPRPKHTPRTLLQLSRNPTTREASYDRREILQ